VISTRSRSSCFSHPTLAILLASILMSATASQAQSSINRAGLESLLNFEAPTTGDSPAGWSGGPAGTIFIDRSIVHGGQQAARIDRPSDDSNHFSTITKSIPIEFSATTLEFRGYLRTENVGQFAGLWMREDGDSGTLQFDNMQSRQLKGSTPWTEYSIKLPLDPNAKQLFFGVLMAGTGRTWVDDLQVLADGKPIWEAPAAQKIKTPTDTDHEFDRGSHVTATKLTPVQIDNLVVLGKVWGFLKYYHPAVTAGQYQWDYELFRVLPTVLQAPDHKSANTVLLNWIDHLGPVAACNPCMKLDQTDLYYPPDIGWIADQRLLGTELSKRLVFIRDNRSGAQFYVSKTREVGNPSFDHELQYAEINFQDFGFQLLAVYRFWNIFEYWSPYRDRIGRDWTSVLAEFIPRVATAQSSDSYKRELLALIATVNDGHANLWGSLDVRPPTGKCSLPITVRFVEDKPTVTANIAAESSVAANLKVGDVITSLDDEPVTKLIDGWKPYYAASNDAARYRAIGASMARGECGDTHIGILRDGKALNLKLTRQAPPDSLPSTHDLPGPTFRLLSKDVAYLKLSSVKMADCAGYIQQAAGTKGLIIDIRNYPSEFVVFSLGSHLVKTQTTFARFTDMDPANPGAFHWSFAPIAINPEEPHYSGKVVILVDESSMSQAEYTAMALRSAPGAIVVGSTTAGADGNVSPFPLPGGIRTMISGISVFYPDKTPTQRVGIVPNIVVNPTIAGIRNGRDEVLEEAIRQILGANSSPAAINDLLKH